MKYKVGDKVRIKSFDWHNQMLAIPSKIVGVGDFAAVKCGAHIFTKAMCKFCGRVMTIQAIGIDFYLMEEDNLGYEFTDEMIEGLAEEETEPKFKVGDKIRLKSTLLNDIFGVIGYESEGYRITNISNGLTYFMSYSIEHYYELVEEETSIDLTVKGEEVKERIEIAIPEGYEYVIESGKIIFTKKKKEYPKSYEECCQALEYIPHTDDIIGYKWDVLQSLQKLLICRDAYWKIAGEEMGLGKPWEPDYTEKTVKYCLRTNYCRIVQTRTSHDNHPFSFPTEEMRDAFYEAFKEDIEICKELL